MIMSEIHNYATYPEELEPCPFCGKKPYWTIKGQDGILKKKTITIRCECGASMEQSAFRYDTDWLKKMMVEKWNKRI